MGLEIKETPPKNRVLSSRYYAINGMIYTMGLENRVHRGNNNGRPIGSFAGHIEERDSLKGGEIDYSTGELIIPKTTYQDIKFSKITSIIVI